MMLERSRCGDRVKYCTEEVVSYSLSYHGQYLGKEDRSGDSDGRRSGGEAVAGSEQLGNRVLQVQSETGERQCNNYLACFKDGGSGRLVQVRGSDFLVVSCR